MEDHPNEPLELLWQGIHVNVCISRDWLQTGYHHIELRAEQSLPVTQTGYRSHFVPAEQFETFDSLEQLVFQWLDQAAQSKHWEKTQEAQRQLSLF